MDLSGLPTLVTGASRGLGAALVSALAREGARVVAVARDPVALGAVVDALRAEGFDVHAVPGDVARKEDVHRIAGAAAALVGPVRLLVHNASTLGPVPLRPLLDTDCEALADVIETNLVGPFRLSKALAGHMAIAGGGLVLHVSSDAAVNGYPGWGAYGVSKAALDHLARAWDAELSGRGVRFLALDPGEMDTRMHADAVPDADRATLARPEDVAARIVAWLPSARTAPPGFRGEVAALPTGPAPHVGRAAAEGGAR